MTQGVIFQKQTVSVDGTTLVVNGNECLRYPNMTINGSVVNNGKREYAAGRIMVHSYYIMDHTHL